MSPRPAAPSRASISAWVTTSPSECPARPRSSSKRIPPSTSGMPSANACASTPSPMRRSDTEGGLELVQRLDPDRLRGGLVQIAPRAAADVHGRHPGGDRRLDVVVDAVADVGDLRWAELDGLCQTPEERRGRLFDAPTLGRAEHLQVAAQHLLRRPRCVSDGRHAKAARAQPIDRRQGVRVEVRRQPGRGRRLDLQDLPDPVVVSAACRKAAEDTHEREARHARRVRGALPHPGLVDERLADVEDDRLQSQAATRSRSACSVTLIRRRSPGTTLTRPPLASTSAAQSVASASPLAAARSVGQTNAWGVCAPTRLSRSSVSTTASPSTRLTVSGMGTAGTTPSQPSGSVVSSRSSTSSASTGRAASWTTATAASSGTASSPARTEAARVSPPVTTDSTFPQASSSASRITGSSQSGGATTTIESIQSDDSIRSRLSASSGRPFSGANALGRSSPRRSPRPAAAMTAQTDIRRRAGLRRCAGLRALLLRVGVRNEDLVQPLGRLLLVEALRVHQLADEDLLRLDEHLLLAGREALVAVAQRQVPHDLGQLEDVAGLHLVAVVLEAAVPVLRHGRAVPGQRLDDFLDGVLVDHLPQADLLGVVSRHVDGHVVVKDLDRQVFALFTQHLARFLLDDRACSVVRIHHLIADLVQARPPRSIDNTQPPAGDETAGEMAPV